MNAKPQQSDATGRMADELVFLSPDRAQAQRVITCLRHVGKIHWKQAPATTQLAAKAASTVWLLDFSIHQAANSAQLMLDLKKLTPSTAVIAVGSIDSDGTACVLAALRAGVKDFIDLDSPNLVDDAHVAITQAVRQRDEQVHAPPLLAASPQPSQGKTIVLLGVRAGVGTSTLVAHLGCMAQQHQIETHADAEHSKNHVLVMDVAEPGGDVALYLNLHGDFEIDNAIDNAERFDATLSRTALPRHESDMAVLSRTLDTPPPSDQQPEFGSLLERLDRLFDLVLIDAGGVAPTQLPATLINMAHEIWLVADQGLATMVSLDSMLRTVRQCGADNDQIHLVMNRCDPESGLTPEQVAQRFKLPLLAAIPDRGPRLRACINSGRLLCESSPHDRYLTALKPMLDRLLQAPGSLSRNSWLDRARHLWRS